MLRTLVLTILLISSSAAGQDAPERPESEQPASEQPASGRDGDRQQATADGPSGVKTLSGMSILGNEEAPKSLVIVPWKSSQIGDGVGINDAMDDRARPVDKEVFMREVHYYELRSGGRE